jgi:hypothetical protein
MASILDNIRAGYEQLEKRVHLALKIQIGDAERLTQTSAAVSRFRNATEPVGPRSLVLGVKLLKSALISTAAYFRLQSSPFYKRVSQIWKQRLSKLQPAQPIR